MTQPKTERPECDITKTQVMVDLFAVPQDQRDEKWNHSFYETVQTASYACVDPQVSAGPDGFPYFVLRTPEPRQPFESFCIRNMTADFLIERGWGVVINPKENAADWVFSYGDIVNLHLNGEFFSTAKTVNIQHEETLEKDEQILVAQPSENYLPAQTRIILKSFLQHIGIEQPKVMLISRTIEGQPLQQLVFNIFREDFETVDHLNYRLNQISWFLPRHYIIVSFPKDSDLNSSFEDL